MARTTTAVSPSSGLKARAGTTGSTTATVFDKVSPLSGPLTCGKGALRQGLAKVDSPPSAIWTTSRAEWLLPIESTPPLALLGAHAPARAAWRCTTRARRNAPPAAQCAAHRWLRGRASRRRTSGCACARGARARASRRRASVAELPPPRLGPDVWQLRRGGAAALRPIVPRQRLRLRKRKQSTTCKGCSRDHCAWGVKKASLACAPWKPNILSMVHFTAPLLGLLGPGLGLAWPPFGLPWSPRGF